MTKAKSAAEATLSIRLLYCLSHLYLLAAAAKPAIKAAERTANMIFVNDGR